MTSVQPWLWLSYEAKASRPAGILSVANPLSQTVRRVVAPSAASWKPS